MLQLKKFKQFTPKWLRVKLQKPPSPFLDYFVKIKGTSNNKQATEPMQRLKKLTNL